MSKGEIFAEPMLDGDEYLNDYVQQLKELQKEGKLPDLKQKMEYKVYSIRGSNFGAHKSVVLSSNDKDFVTVELGFYYAESGTRHIYPVTRALDSNQKHKLKYHGTIKTSGGNLIAHAIATMKEFGSYFKFCNNCQDFCNIYLESIGLAGEKSLTDSDKASRLAVIGSIAVGLLAILLKLLSRK